MKKALAIIIALLLCATAVVALCACDFDEDSLTVTFASTMGKTLREVFASAVQDFNAIYPNIKIKHDTSNSKYPALQSANSKKLTTNKGPSITYCYPDHVASYNNKNKVVDLNQFANSTEVIPADSIYGNTTDMVLGYTAAEKADFIPAFYAEGTKSYGDGSKMYSMALAKSSEVLYYNKDFFTAQTIEVPTHWWCEEQICGHTDSNSCTKSMEYVCAQIKAIDNDCYPLGYDSDSNFFITICEQMGIPYTSTTGNKYLFDNAEAKAIMTRFNKWYQNGWLITSGTFNDNYTSDLFTEAASKTNSYMCIGSTGGATYQKPSGDAFETGVAPIPQYDANNPKVIMQGPSICMLNVKGNKTDEQQKAAWLFIKFLTTNTKFQATFSINSGYLSVMESVQTNDVYVDEFLSLADGGEFIAARAATQCIAQQDAFYTSPAFIGSSEAREQVGVLFANCLTLTGSNIATEMNNKFAQAVSICEAKAPSKA